MEPTLRILNLEDDALDTELALTLLRKDGLAAEIDRVDTQAAFDNILTELHPMALAADRVHPNLTGHMLLARAFLNAVDYTW